MNPSKYVVAAMVAISAIVPGVLADAPVHAAATGPRPVYTPSGGFYDPGALLAGKSLYVFGSGRGGKVAKATHSGGPWKAVGRAVRMGKAPGWVDRSAPLWAPDAWKIGRTYVLYYSAAVTGAGGGRRCIGVGTSKTPAGPYTPLAGKPLVCTAPNHRGEDTVPGRPLASAGVIDPSPFVDGAGRRFLAYKTQGRPSSLRVVRLGSQGQHHLSGHPSRQLVRSSGIIENPVVRQVGGQFVLLASKYGYNNCSYETVWMHAKTLARFGSVTQHVLIKQRHPGLCGPGGADITHAIRSGYLVFLHAWSCGEDHHECSTDAVSSEAKKQAARARRQLYVAHLRWKGYTPVLGSFS